ncbi:ferredoxin subunit of nitrite reductase and ring-hydroxylating dioxygenase [Halogeometricum borinquense DSM 11551]|uniref:Ferredoxin subunit of nitrite reductase and ring-hydroxylating dioxygenase n=2 Tax=Halogeometricum borinquense (strain ATCC 700274 / DSM 11551 / JCM 10706 / KCTC 4070 / PR3) TaxID=469382 RepID=E4NN36_HALBP|nr:ferredoxin subunit of nitrite reductase and ring-hydroxylating dioxygenase [Halogeometricum borinquense DSM 11551]
MLLCFMGSIDRFRETVPLAELEREGRVQTSVDGRALALFHHEGEIRVVDNRCPHMGFPLSEGSVEDGVLTCHWHHARFELSCGDTFDPWADDVQTFPVEIRDGSVYVDPHPEPDEPPAEHWMRRLEDGLEQNLRLVVAKSAIGLADAGVSSDAVVERGVRFGSRYRESGWGPGLTILAAMRNVLPDLADDDRKRALYQGLVHVAGDCADAPPRFDQEPFDTEDVSFERLKAWFRENIKVRDADGAERVLRTAIANGADDAHLAEMLVAAATDHRYLNTGHTLDFVNKACEVLDHVGWDHGDAVLPSLIEGMATATRAEERSSWRQPVDLAAMVSETFADLDSLVESGAGTEWSPPASFTETLLSDDPEIVVAALEDAIREGASVEALAREVAFAAGTRVAQFATVNEFSDWNTVHHTFTYANAVHQLARRTGARELYRGVFDAAINVYLDRFLNTPPAPLPRPASSTETDLSVHLDELLDSFDVEGEVDEAGRRAAHYLDCGGDVSLLRERLAESLLREDAGFHTYQALEAGFTQAELRDSPEEVRTLLVAVARYLSAHFPTRREREQTFTIAARLHRGEKIHEEGQ